MITRRHLELLLVMLAAFSWLRPGPAAERNPAADLDSEYNVTKWSVENRLPESFVRALAQTPDGYLWVGTLNGLARFDGNQFKDFDHSTTPEMAHESIDALAVDRKTGGLWIGTGAGLLYYQNHRFRRFALSDSDSAPLAVGVMEPSRQGGIWFSARSGQVGLVRDGKLATWNFAPNRIGFTVFQILEQDSESLLVSMADTNCVLDWKLKQVRSLSQVLPKDLCHRFFRDVRGSLWICGDHGLWHQSDTNWINELAAQRPARPWPEEIGQTRDGRILVRQAEARGISLQLLTNGRLKRVIPEENPDGLRVACWLEDYEGNLWVGCKTGLLRLEPKRVRSYSSRDGLRNEDAKVVTESPDGTIWVVTAGGLSSIRQGEVDNQSSPLALAADNLGRVWGFMPDTLDRLDSEATWTIPTPPNLPQLGFKVVYEDRDHHIWLGTGHGVLRLEGTQWNYIPMTNSTSRADVRVIHQDRRGDMWFGTYGSGLWRFRDGHLTQFLTDRGPENNRAWWIHEDADGIFWIGSEEGLNRFVPPGLSVAQRQKSIGLQSRGKAQFFTFTKSQGLYENVVNNIQEDQFGYLWLSGLGGIYRVSRQELNDVVEGKRTQVGCLALGEADGMLSCECNGGDDQPSGCSDSHGRIWFPTTQGVAVVDPKEFLQKEVPPRVVIEEVKADNQVIYGDEAKAGAAIESGFRNGSTVGDRQVLDGKVPQLHIGPGRARVLEIYYTANSFTAPERVRFKYRLDGFSQEWESDNSNRRMALYTNLRPRNYTFRLRACNNRGVWSQPDTLMTFSIAPYFYQTTPFYAGCVLLLVALVWAVHHARLRALDRLRKLEQQHALDLERARISRDIHDDLGSRFLQISVLGELTQRTLAASNNPIAHLEKLRTTAGEAFQALDEIVWAVNPKQDSLAGLLSYLREFAPQFLAPAGIHCHLDFPASVPNLRLAAQTRHDLFLAIKEGLQNVVKHAGAKEVTLRLTIEGKRLRFSIRDDGVGLAQNGHSMNGNGMANMRHRTAQIGGELTVLSEPGQGTELRFELDL